MRVSRGARVLVAAAIMAATGLTAAAAFAGGGVQGPTFGYGRYVREARAFRFCQSFTRPVARYRSCLSEQAPPLLGPRLVLRTAADDSHLDRHEARPS